MESCFITLNRNTCIFLETQMPIKIKRIWFRDSIHIATVCIFLFFLLLAAVFQVQSIFGHSSHWVSTVTQCDVMVRSSKACCTAEPLVWEGNQQYQADKHPLMRQRNFSTFRCRVACFTCLCERRSEWKQTSWRRGDLRKASVSHRKVTRFVCCQLDSCKLAWSTILSPTYYYQPINAVKCNIGKYRCWGKNYLLEISYKTASKLKSKQRTIFSGVDSVVLAAK